MEGLGASGWRGATGGSALRHSLQAVHGKEDNQVSREWSALVGACGMAIIQVTTQAWGRSLGRGNEGTGHAQSPPNHLNL